MSSATSRRPTCGPRVRSPEYDDDVTECRRAIGSTWSEDAVRRVASIERHFAGPFSIGFPVTGRAAAMVSVSAGVVCPFCAASVFTFIYCPSLFPSLFENLSPVKEAVRTPRRVDTSRGKHIERTS